MCRTSFLPFFLSLLLFSSLSSPVFAQREKFSPEELDLIEKKWPEAKKAVTGLRYVIQEPGTGEPARSGDLVSVIYRGMLLLDGRIFNEFLDKEKPFTFRLGRGEVIDGWDQGLKLMRAGSKAVLIVPYELAYGTLGNPPAVPKRSSLVFEIEMLKIERGAPPPPEPEPKKKRRWFGGS